MDWDSLLDNADYQRLRTTSAYKKWEKKKTLRSGRVGLAFEVPEQSPPVIVKVLTDSSAHQAGLLEGDLLLGVDGVKTHGMGPEQLADKIRGKPGSIAVLRIKRGAQTLTFRMPRKLLVSELR